MGLPKEKRRTQAAVLGPTPLSVVRKDSASSAGSSSKWNRFRSCVFDLMAWRTSFILLAFMFSSPPTLMVSAILSSGALRRLSGVGYLVLRLMRAG